MRTLLLTLLTVAFLAPTAASADCVETKVKTKTPRGLTTTAQAHTLTAETRTQAEIIKNWTPGDTVQQCKSHPEIDKFYYELVNERTNERALLTSPVLPTLPELPTLPTLPGWED